MSLDLCEIWRKLAGDVVPTEVAEAHIQSIETSPLQPAPVVIVDMLKGFYQNDSNPLRANRKVHLLMHRLQQAGRSICITHPYQQAREPDFHQGAVKGFQDIGFECEDASHGVFVRMQYGTNGSPQAELYVSSNKSSNDAFLTILHPRRLTTRTRSSS